MPINRNTSSRGAPKRSASRLDKMPAMIRTAPSRMAMLTVSRDAMKRDKSLRIEGVASLPSPHLPANRICAKRGDMPIFRPLLTLPVYCYCGGPIPAVAGIRFEILTMDMDLSDLLAPLQTAARSVGAEVASPWFYLQLGLVLAGAGLAFAASAAVRARVDINSLGTGLPGTP